RFDASALPCRIAGEVRGFRPEDWVEPREVGRMEDFILYAIAAATEAVRDAGLEVTEETAERTGVVIGVGIGGLGGIERNHDALAAGGPRRVSPFFIPAVISNLAPAQIAMRIGARGVNMATTTACASGAHAIGEAFEMIRSGRQDVVVAGGAEAAITPTAIAGFGVMRAHARRGARLRCQRRRLPHHAAAARRRGRPPRHGAGARRGRRAGGRGRAR